MDLAEARCTAARRTLKLLQTRTCSVSGPPPQPSALPSPATLFVNYSDVAEEQDVEDEEEDDAEKNQLLASKTAGDIWSPRWKPTDWPDHLF